MVLLDEVELNFLDNETVAYNSLYDTSAIVYHGNGPSKVFWLFCESSIELFVIAVPQFPW